MTDLTVISHIFVTGAPGRFDPKKHQKPKVPERGPCWGLEVKNFLRHVSDFAVALSKLVR